MNSLPPKHRECLDFDLVMLVLMKLLDTEQSMGQVTVQHKLEHGIINLVRKRNMSMIQRGKTVPISSVHLPTQICIVHCWVKDVETSRNQCICFRCWLSMSTPLKINKCCYTVGSRILIYQHINIDGDLLVYVTMIDVEAVH